MNLKRLLKVVINLLTLSRIIFSFLLLNIINKINPYFFIVTLTLVFFTDFLDGYLARKFEVQTLFGSLMDTIADKVLSVVLILPLLGEQSFIWLVLIGELVIALLNIVGIVKRKYTYSSMMGKLKMWLLSIIIILGYIYFYGYISCYMVIFGCILTFGLQLFVIWEYYQNLCRQSFRKKIGLYSVCNFKDLVYVFF